MFSRMSASAWLTFLSTLPARGATRCGDAYHRGSAFLSTLPARGATPGPCGGQHPPVFLSTLPARGATRAISIQQRIASISIHAPREGSDTAALSLLLIAHIFLSTLPARGATDLDTMQHIGLTDFYPRSPRGERPKKG